MPQLKFTNLPTSVKNEINVPAPNVVIVAEIAVDVFYSDGRPAAGAPYVLTLQPGGERKGTLNANGSLREQNIPAGAKGTLSIPGSPVIALTD